MYLNVHSQYSLRYGTMSVKKLVAEAVSRGIGQMALTDINNSTGVMEFMRECDLNGIKPIGGIEFRKGMQLLYIGIARNREGMKELNEFLTFHNLQRKELPERAGLFRHAVIVYPYDSLKKEQLLLGHEYIGIRADELHTLHGKDLSAIQDKLLVLQPVFVADRIEYRLHEYLRAIDLNSLLTMVAPADKCVSTDVFLSPGQLEAHFSR